MAFTKQELEALRESNMLAGKSPHTGIQGVAISAALDQVIQRELTALNDAEKRANGAAHKEEKVAQDA